MPRCGNCGVVVTAFEKACPKCGNKNIKRKTDSYWIFTINTQKKLQYYIDAERIYLLIDNEADTEGNNILARFRVWLLQPKKDQLWREYVKEYYNIYYLKKEKGEKMKGMDASDVIYSQKRTETAIQLDD